MRQGGRSLARSCALSLAALAAPGAAPAADVASHVPGQRAAEVREFWTPERMADARPASDLLAGVPAPIGLRDGLLGAAAPAPRAAAQQVASPAKRPFRTHGKVFFTLEGTPFQCSATAVRAKTKRLVVTAGHCVYGDVLGSPPGGEFATNWMFIPGKNGNAEPYGRWSAGRMAVPNQWAASEDIRFDVGMVSVRARNGRKLQNVVGARGIAFNRGRNLHFNAFGYPADGPARFDGETLFRCDSNGQGRDGGPPPQPTRIDCDMTGGSSGGGWIVGGRRVNSVISYGYECQDVLCDILGGNPEEGKLFGPYFGATIKSLYRAERR